MLKTHEADFWLQYESLISTGDSDGNKIIGLMSFDPETTALWSPVCAVIV